MATDPHSPAASDAAGSADDPFTLLGLPPRLSLSSDQIQRAYLLRMAAAHPDATPDSDLGAGVGSGLGSGLGSGVGSDGNSGDDAAVLAARLNQARRILSHPERRAIALYTRLLRTSAQDAGAIPDAKADAALPAGFLMEILSTREEIEAALASRDQAAMDSWRAWAMGQRGEYLAKVGALLDARDLRAAREQLNAWRYIERLIEQLDPAYDPNRADFAG